MTVIGLRYRCVCVFFFELALFSWHPFVLSARASSTGNNGAFVLKFRLVVEREIFLYRTRGSAVCDRLRSTPVIAFLPKTVSINVADFFS